MTDHAKELETIIEAIKVVPGAELTEKAVYMMEECAAEIRRLQDVEKRYEYLRKLNVPQFEDLYIRCLHEDLNFDDFVLQLANGEVIL